MFKRDLNSIVTGLMFTKNISLDSNLIRTFVPGHLELAKHKPGAKALLIINRNVMHMDEPIIAPKISERVLPQEIEEPEPKELLADDWLCAACLKKITSEKFRFFYDHLSEFTFTNPGGYSFDIITFYKAEGCFAIGEPTFDHSWFKDHAWSICLCKGCGTHLGWRYSGEFSFFGLIRRKLLRGFCLFN